MVFRKERTGGRTERAIDLFLNRIDREGWENSAAMDRPEADSDLASDLSRIVRIWNGEGRAETGDASGVEAASNLMDLPPAVGPFRIERVLGRGGFGTVLLAREEPLGRAVALKFLHRDSRAAKHRFLREAALVAELKHPSLVPIYRFGEEEGRPYFAMEYVEGTTLAKVIAQVAAGMAKEPHGRSPLGTLISSRKNSAYTERYAEFVARVALRMAETLAYAHRRGVIHRDFKPGNVLIDLGGRPRLSDFGLAQRLDAESAAPRQGTYPYMAPEQVRGEEPDFRSDIFSFGSTLYEMLTLRRPFPGRTAKEISESILRREPPAPRSLDPEIPRALEAICLKCLRKEKRFRYESAEALARDLGRFAHGEPVEALGPFLSRIHASEYRWTVARRLGIACVGAGFALLGYLAAQRGTTTRETPPDQEKVEAVVQDFIRQLRPPEEAAAPSDMKLDPLTASVAPSGPPHDEGTKAESDPPPSAPQAAEPGPETDPPDHDARILRAALAIAEHNLDLAAREIRAEIRDGKAHSDLWAVSGLMASIRTGGREDSFVAGEQDFEEALQLNPENLLALVAYGMGQASQGKAQRSIAHHQRAFWAFEQAKKVAPMSLIVRSYQDFYRRQGYPLGENQSWFPALEAELKLPTRTKDDPSQKSAIGMLLQAVRDYYTVSDMRELLGKRLKQLGR